MEALIRGHRHGAQAKDTAGSQTNGCLEECHYKRRRPSPVQQAQMSQLIGMALEVAVKIIPHFLSYS